MPKESRSRRRGPLPEVTLDEQKMALCIAVFGDDSVLSHVFPRQFPSGGRGYMVLDKTDTQIAEFSERELGLSGKDRFDFVVDLVQTLYCAECADRLLDGEERVCGPCEAAQVMELLRMRDDLG